MREQFILNYTGNKYNESKNLDECIDYDKYDTIIEPFGGSFGYIRYLYNKGIRKTFIVMDNNKDLINFYKYLKKLKNPYKIRDLYNKEMDKIFDECKYKEVNKVKYLEVNKVKIYLKNIKVNKYVTYLLKHNLGHKRGVLTTAYKKDVNMDIFKHIKFIHGDMKTYNFNKYINSTTLIYLDPPYLSTRNDSYVDEDILGCFKKMYELFKTSNSIFIHVQHPILNILLEKFKKHEYTKLYQLTKKNVKHIVYFNCY